MKKLVNFLKDWGLLLLAGLVLILGIILSLKGFFDKAIDKVSDSFDNGVNYDNLDETGANISDADARRIAEGLYVAMDRPGSNEEKIYSLLNGINYGDYAKIYNVFGSRKYLLFGGFGNPFATPLDLYGWLEKELDEDEVKKLSSITVGVF